jgi:hypothetical protein
MEEATAMSDRLDSSPTPASISFLRQTFAWRLRRPEDLVALARVLEMIEEWAMETGQFGPEDRRDTTAAAIEAAGRDVLFLACFLEEQARERFGSALTEKQTRLCERAEHWAVRVRELGAEIVAESAEDAKL